MLCPPPRMGARVNEGGLSGFKASGTCQYVSLGIEKVRFNAGDVSLRTMLLAKTFGSLPAASTGGSGLSQEA